MGRIVSRNAIIGKLHRMGISLGSDQPNRAAAEPRPPRITRTKPRIIGARKGRNFGSLWGPYPIEEAETYIPKASEIVCLDIPFHQLRAGECKFIPGEPTYDAPACGHPVKFGKLYCPGHHALTHIKPGTSRPHLKEFNRRPTTSVLSNAHEAVSEWESAA